MSKKNHGLESLGTPTLVWFLLFLLGPFFLVLVTSFLSRGEYGGIAYHFSLDSYARALSLSSFKVLIETLKLSLITTALCLVIGYPMAWAMATLSRSTRAVVVLLLAIPFLTNLLVRIFSVRLLFGYEGPIEMFLQNLAFDHDPYSLSQNQGLVLYGMFSTYLPFMVYSLYSSLERFDFSLLEANADLGGGPFHALFSVLIPNTRPAIANGLILVFVPCLGEFVIPDLLGGAKNMLMGNLITEQFLKARDWPYGSALSILLLLVIVTLTFLIQRWGQGRGSQWKN